MPGTTRPAARESFSNTWGSQTQGERELPRACVPTPCGRPCLTKPGWEMARREIGRVRSGQQKGSKHGRRAANRVLEVAGAATHLGSAAAAAAEPVGRARLALRPLDVGPLLLHVLRQGTAVCEQLIKLCTPLLHLLLQHLPIAGCDHLQRARWQARCWWGSAVSVQGGRGMRTRLALPDQGPLVACKTLALGGPAKRTTDLRLADWHLARPPPRPRAHGPCRTRPCSCSCLRRKLDGRFKHAGVREEGGR